MAKSKTVHEHLRDHILISLGMVKPTLQELQESQWDSHFETLMRNRLVMGAFRYGQLRFQFGINYDNIQSIQKRCEAYLNDGNGEHLIDIANIAMVECLQPSGRG